MDQIFTREKEEVIDLERDGTINEEVEEGNSDAISSVRKTQNFLDRVWSGVNIDRSSEKGEYRGVGISLNSPESAELLVDKRIEGDEFVNPLMKKTEEKRKKKNSKISPKPPRPPKGPLLDAADHKLIREISELAMLKRARIERMKAYKKMKAAKAASSNSNLYAMVFTVLFCLVILFQGMSSRSSPHLSFQGSPQSAVAMRGRLISIQYYKNVSANNTEAPGSVSPSLVEQLSGSSPDGRGGSRVSE